VTDDWSTEIAGIRQ